MSADTNITIDGNNYKLSTNNPYTKRNPNILKFETIENTNCFVAFEFDKNNSSVWIKFWNCTSEKGTGVVLMKDFLTYLLDNPQPININKSTVIQAHPKATAIQNPRVTDRNQTKLISFYATIGFENKENEGGEWGGGVTKVSGTIDNIINKITSYRSARIGGKFRKTKRRKTKRRRYTKRSK